MNYRRILAAATVPIGMAGIGVGMYMTWGFGVALVVVGSLITGIGLLLGWE